MSTGNTKSEAKAVEARTNCITCGARRGASCRDESGEALRAPHRIRAADYARAMRRVEHERVAMRPEARHA